MSDPFEFFDAIYCINLDTRPDRCELAMREFAALGIAGRVDLWCAMNLKSYCAQPLLAWQRDGLSDIEGTHESRASEARRMYVRFVAAPHADAAIREFAQHNLRRRLLRIRIRRRLRRLATRLGVP